MILNNTANSSGLSTLVIGLFSSINFWSALVACIGIITIGIFLNKNKWVQKNFLNFKTSLNNLVVIVAMPALIIYVYLQDISISVLKDLSVVILISIFYSIGLFLLSFVVARFFPKFLSEKWLIKKYNEYFELEKSKQDINLFDKNAILAKIRDKHREYILVKSLLALFNSITFFGLPLIQAIFGQEGTLLLIMFQTIPVVVCYFYTYVILGRIKIETKTIFSSLKKCLLNSIMIIMFVMLFLWLSQLIPGLNKFTGPWFEYNKPNKPHHGWLNFKVTFPIVYRILQLLQYLVTPIVWIITGLSIGKLNLKNSFSKPDIWILLIFKFILIPLVFLIIFILLDLFKVFHLAKPYSIGNEVSVAGRIAIPSIIMAILATPTTPVLTSFAVSFKNSEEDVSLVVGSSSLLSPIMMILWIIVSFVTFSAINI